MSSQPDGKIPNTYREKSRWITVKNDSEFEIPPFAPCHFILWGGYKDEEQPIVMPFTGQNIPGRSSLAVANPANFSMCVNGPTAIPSNGFGEVTIDYPCVARVKHFKNRLNDPSRWDDSFQPVYVDLNSAARGKAVSYFSDIGHEGLGYRILPYLNYYRNAIPAFQAIAIADLGEDLYWIVPRERPASSSNSSSVFNGVSSSQEIITDFPLTKGSSTEDWAVVSDDGGIIFNLPGSYSLSIYLQVADGGILENQSTTLPTDYRLEYETESLSDQLDGAAFVRTTIAAIRQPSHLYQLNCSGGYGTCPTMDVARPAVSANRTAVFTVSVTDDWEIPTADGKVVAVPLVKLKLSRTVNFNFTGEVSRLNATINVTRSGFDEFYRHGYYGYWGYWGYYGYGYGFGNTGEFIG